MAYLSLKETHYHAKTNGKNQELILTVPHGSGADSFLEHFPEIQCHPDLERVWPLFRTYLEIERDTGASELAHAIARNICLNFQHQVHVLEMNYPRGILDGGRLRGHALRHCLPQKLMESIQGRLEELHDNSLRRVDEVYALMAQKAPRHALLVDIHTMASFCPVDESGRRSTFPISFARLEDYVNQYLEAKNHHYQRKIDLICADEKGHLLADDKLLSEMKSALEAAGYDCLENQPYHAAPIYLSYQHMKMVPSLSIDVPKHDLVFSDRYEYELDNLDLDPTKVQSMAKVMAGAIHRSFSQ